VRPGLVHGPAAAALDLLGEVLACLGQGLVGQRDQVKMIDRDRGAGKPHPQCFPERNRRVNGDDPHAQAPGQRSGEEPVPDAPRPGRCPGSTMVVIQGSYRVQVFDAGSWK
jgi:hypothetical protein